MRDNQNITAHSGCDGTPDDSLESIEAGIRYGADAVEVDVRFNKKGVLILSHDEDPEKEYRDHPSLAEAFDLIARDGGIGVNCDIKELDTIRAILELGGEKGISPERLILTGSVTPLSLEENPAILERSSVWINIEEPLRHFCRTGDEAVRPYRDLIMSGMEEDELLAALKPHAASLMEAVLTGCLRWGVKVLNMPYMETMAAMIPRMRERGISASVWTVNKEGPLKQLFGLGALNVTTRDTRLAVEARKGSG
jgi:glycerophosphoryl diester phosphodiesterase